jgi:hypothetical protein
MGKSKKPVQMKKKTATIVDKPVVWKNLKELNGESFLLKMKPKFKGCDYVIENNYKEEITILNADDKGKVIDWKAVSKQAVEEDGYEIL